MPMLEIVTSKKVTATVSLESSTAELVDRYAAYTKNTADNVVNAALEYIFTKDREFKAFCDSKSNAKPVSALRVKKPVSAAKSNGVHGTAAD